MTDQRRFYRVAAVLVLAGLLNAEKGNAVPAEEVLLPAPSGMQV